MKKTILFLLLAVSVSAKAQKRIGFPEYGLNIYYNTDRYAPPSNIGRPIDNMRGFDRVIAVLGEPLKKDRFYGDMCDCWIVQLVYKGLTFLLRKRTKFV